MAGVLGMLLVACIVAGVSAAWGATTTVDKNLDTHERTDGHPVIVERVNGLRQKVDEIAAEQMRQADTLRDIRKIVTDIRDKGGTD